MFTSDLILNIMKDEQFQTTERCICELEGSLFCNDREKLVFYFESNWRFREENGCKAKFCCPILIVNVPTIDLQRVPFVA